MPLSLLIQKLSWLQWMSPPFILISIIKKESMRVKLPSTHVLRTSALCDLIVTILKCNTLKFGERFFHQIEGTAMGTPMAVNLANLFMGKFETDLLNDYQNKYNKSPGIWLRYIYDIFFHLGS